MTLVKRQTLEGPPRTGQMVSIEKLFDPSFANSLEKDELVYKKDLIRRLQAAEEDIRNGRTIPHSKMVREVRKWFVSNGPKKRRKI